MFFGDEKHALKTRFFKISKIREKKGQNLQFVVLKKLLLIDFLFFEIQLSKLWRVESMNITLRKKTCF